MIGKHFISIWFFIGLLLSVYGVLILGTGLYELLTHASLNVVMAQVHVNIWWGAGMSLLGLIYLFNFWPTCRSNLDEER